MGKTIYKAGVVKYFLGLFLPISIVISLALLGAYKIEVNSSKKILLVNENHIAYLYLESISNLFNNAMSNTLFLSRSEEIKGLLGGMNGATSEELDKELLAFCELNPSCGSITVLDSSGKEIAGMTKTIEGALVSAESGPVSTDKYAGLHAESMKLSKGEVYFSPVEAWPASEDGGTEKREQISIVTPLFNDDSERTGSVLVTLLAKKLIDNLRTPVRGSINQHLIIDQNGYILYGGPLLSSNNYTLREVTGSNFGSLHPTLWQQISVSESGQYDAANHFRDTEAGEDGFEDSTILSDGLYTFKTIYNTGSGFAHKELTETGEQPELAYPDGRNEAYWKIVTYLPREVFVGTVLQKKYILGEAGLILLTLIFCLFHAAHRFNRMKAETSLMVHEKRYRMLHHSAFDGIVLADSKGIIVESNPSMEEIFGYSNEELTGMDINLLLPEELRNNPKRGFNRFIRGSGNEFMETVLRANGLHRSSDTFPMELTINRIKIDDSFFIACTIRDISDRKASEETIRKLAYYDQLTGLPNRSLFNDRLHQAIIRAKRSGLQMGLLLLDFDRFKTLNDTFGHTSGDEFLKEVANRLLTNIRAADSVAHLGGDEFVLFVSDKDDVEDIMLFANKLSSLFKQSFELNGYEFFMGCSIGVSIYPHDGRDVTTLMNNAVTAMGKAKAEGGGGFCLYSPSMNTRAAERLELEKNLRLAQENNEFFLNYQPQVDAATGKVVGVEALIRWRDSYGTVIPPFEFIPLAESLRLIVPIGEWVLRTACKRIRMLHHEGLDDLNISVNVSLAQLMDRNFQKTLSNILEETGLNPRHLELEITETIAMENVSQTIELLNGLKSTGVKLSIDDFGTGYSSLSHLKRMPIDILKIDRSFINELTVGDDDRMLVKTIINIAHGFNNRVVAEGVETVEQYQILKEYGCDIIQGYLFSKPVPAEEIQSCYHAILEERMKADEEEENNKDKKEDVKEVI